MSMIPRRKQNATVPTIARPQSTRKKRPSKTSVDELMNVALDTSRRHLMEAKKNSARLDNTMPETGSIYVKDEAMNQKVGRNISPPRQNSSRASFSPTTSARGRHSRSSFEPQSSRPLASSRLSSRLSSSRPSSPLTSREVVREIRSRVDNNMDTLEYIPSIDELPKKMFSWNGKAPTKKIPKMLNKPMPPYPVNILGVNQSLDLIFAKADYRMRHQKMIVNARDEIDRERLEKTINYREHLESRGGINSRMAERQQRQKEWLCLLAITSYMSSLGSVVQEKQEMIRQVEAGVTEALRIKKAFQSWYNRTIFRRYCLKMRKLLGVSNVILRINLRIRMKRKACNLISTFLRHYHITMNSYNKVIRTFAKSVRLVQKNVRAFRLCRAAKIDALSIIWLRLERKYLYKMLRLEQSRKQRLRSKIIDLESLPPKEKQDIRVQDNKWNSVDVKMQERVRILKRFRVIEAETEEETIKRLQIPEHIRRKEIGDTIIILRQSFFRDQMYSKKKQPTSSDQFFNNTEARDMIMGRNVEVFQSMIAAKFDKKLPMVMFSPFYLFKTVTPALLNKLLLQAHQKQNTFELVFAPAVVGGMTKLKKEGKSCSL